MECLQAHIANVKMAEEKHAREKELAAQKEALKGSVTGSNKTNTKSSAPAMVKKNLSVETDSGSGVPIKSSEEIETDEMKTPEGKEADDDDDDDDFGRGEESPMTREELEKESSNSVSNLDRLNTEDSKNDDGNDKNTMSKTLSSTQLKQMFELPKEEGGAEAEA